MLRDEVLFWAASTSWHVKNPLAWYLRVFLLPFVVLCVDNQDWKGSFFFSLSLSKR